VEHDERYDEQYPVVRLGPGAGPRLTWENDACLFIL
jgi:hypothetical protein